MASFCRFMKAFKRTCLAILTCVFALVGAFVGMIMGAVAGQTKEIGFFKGAGVGAFGGAVLSMEVIESMVQGRFFSLEGIFASMVNGKVFWEWMTPAILTAYQQQVDGVDTSSEVILDIFNAGGTKGLLLDSIQKLQLFDISYQRKNEACVHQTSCAICLQDFDEGDAARRLPPCGHIFHSFCIDKWLVRSGCCPICRIEISM